ncbi:hypothetical protein ThrDRAFT_03669 [Frankia casuarinae]|uniref:Uncharacterized protein n=1 Tax=Frankia casuarinae (strain DSM 45818 / CECT 9043 / HFP020203 / CcI3) TaxID=106370 RepID=Q2JC98_FRACC|nr:MULTISPECIES: hypothetical protein [Frankia]ABD11094.1 hypothetical protein Francci3_1718 [Frankia casuarinae]EYT90673.1 hypothetical protein ThrDRAFT_03669 [Frankia casuarinae]OFB39736.1 hypothetical protein Manayef4_20225 [Frankia sp. CgIM4]
MTAARTMRVTISGVYSEYEVPANDDRWNGFAVPGFTLDQVRQLAAETDALGATVDADEIDTITIGDDGIVSVHSGHWNCTTIVVPDPDGLYYVGGYEWAWEIVGN